MAYIIQTAGVTLPPPTKVTQSSEPVWSSDTGRNSAGNMMGTQVAKKRTFEVVWGVLTQAEADQIHAATAEAYFTLTINGISLTVYRGSIQGEQIGMIGGTFYFRSLTVSFIEQ